MNTHHHTGRASCLGNTLSLSLVGLQSVHIQQSCSLYIWKTDSDEGGIFLDCSYAQFYCSTWRLSVLLGGSLKLFTSSNTSSVEGERETEFHCHCISSKIVEIWDKNIKKIVLIVHYKAGRSCLHWFSEWTNSFSMAVFSVKIIRLQHVM